ncbi:MAG TPA: diguanylate cyclase, partial [Pyrinomonadaceae bacterium]|nr:diguanylate cyclase [Pyrinomonadaceae bacterium]
LGIAAVVHFGVTRILNVLYAFVNGKEAIYESFNAQIVRTSVPYALSVAGTLLLNFVLDFFGLAFGWVMLAVAVVGHLAYRIHNDRLEQKVREIGEASRIHLATVEALATAIDARDQVGRGHVLRTQIYAVGVGQCMGLPEDEIQALRTGALLHDIGKLAVPDHILNKPGRLTPAEMEKIKIHASVGASILESIGFSDPVIPTIRHHHESWDGTGYPDGLKAKAIPLTARILSVADAFDTLRGARPYRAAVSKEEARRFLINGAGSQFDPTIVDVFCRNLAQFEEQIATKSLDYDADVVSVESAGVPEEENRSYIEQIKRANREVFTLYELARTFSASLSTESIYSLFAQKIRELVPFDTCVIYQHNELTDEARAVYIEGVNDTALKNVYVKSGEGGTGFALKKRQAVASDVPNLEFSFSQVTLTQDYSAMASLPLIAKEKLLGAVSIYSCSIARYEDEHLRLLETVSRIAADAIFKSINHAETESRALTDPMTGLPNARSLQAQFEKESARSDRHDSKFQLLMLDLDGFKAVNDTFGHKVGDKLLKEISKVMRGQLRDYDFLARYAGDEFVAIIPETDDRSVNELCQRIEKAVSNFILPVGDGRFARVGISVGAATYPGGGKLLDQLLITADKAMYEVKVRRKRLKYAAKKAKQTVELQPKDLGKGDSRTAPTARSAQPETVMLEQENLIVETVEVIDENLIVGSVEVAEESLLVELDESHIVSNAIN